MKNRLLKLLTVKSVVTMSLTAVFCVLSVRRDISPDLFMTVFTTVIAFYFGTQTKKEERTNDD